MIKQDIIKAREELTVKEARYKGCVFERTYKTIREGSGPYGQLSAGRVDEKQFQH